MTPHDIKAFRKRKGLSQSELGDLCGVGKSAVSQWESGNSEPTGGARKLLEDYISGARCIVPLTEQEERLLDENVQRGNFGSREDFLTSSLVHLIRHGSFDLPLRVIAAEDPAEYGAKQPANTAPFISPDPVAGNADSPQETLGNI